MSSPAGAVRPARGTHEETPTPSWLLTAEPAMCQCGPAGRRRGSFVEKTLSGGADLMRQVMFSEETAARPGLLQRVDPRAKIVAMLVLLVATAYVRNLPTLAVLYAAVLALAAASRLRIWDLVKRVWLFVPLFTLIAVLPATLSIVTHGDVVLTLWTWNGRPQGFTSQGLTSAGLVVSRVGVSVTLVALLTLTTTWVRLLAALRGVGVPRMFVLIVGMAYRYVFTLLGAVSDMYESRKARTVGSVRHDGSSRRFVAASAGALLGKAGHLSEEVHQAMVARGYRGNARALQASRFRVVDAGVVLAAIGCAALILWGDRLLGR